VSLGSTTPLKAVNRCQRFTLQAPPNLGGESLFSFVVTFCKITKNSLVLSFKLRYFGLCGVGGLLLCWSA
jgi:hypothetical protein